MWYIYGLCDIVLCVKKPAQPCLAETGPCEPHQETPFSHLQLWCHQRYKSRTPAFVLSLLRLFSSTDSSPGISTPHQQGAPCCAALLAGELEAWSLASLPKVWPAKQTSFSQQRFKNLLKTKIKDFRWAPLTQAWFFKPATRSHTACTTDLLSNTAAGNFFSTTHGSRTQEQRFFFLYGLVIWLGQNLTLTEHG